MTGEVLMTYVAIITSLMLIQFFVFSFKSGKARDEYNIKAPATVGDPTFERLYRIHHNTMEQLVIAIPSMWIFATYVHALIAAGLGLVYLIGRMVYAKAYLADPESRGPGFMMSGMPAIILAVGALIGAIVALVKSGQYY